MRESLILLPGLMCDWRIFGPQIAFFREDYTICVPEYGLASTIDQMAEAVLKAIESETPEASPINILGFSMGGFVALALWARADENLSRRIQRVGFLDTTFHPDTPEAIGFRNQHIAELQSGRELAPIFEEIKPIYWKPDSKSGAGSGSGSGAEDTRHASDQAEMEAIVTKMALDLGKDVFIAQSKALRDRPSYETLLPQVHRPSVVAGGDGDQLCSPENHQQMAALLPRARCHIIPDAGHMATLEQPDKVNQVLQAWLAMTP